MVSISMFPYHACRRLRACKIGAIELTAYNIRKTFAFIIVEAATIGKKRPVPDHLKRCHLTSSAIRLASATASATSASVGKKKVYITTAAGKNLSPILNGVACR